MLTVHRGARHWDVPVHATIPNGRIFLLVDDQSAVTAVIEGADAAVIEGADLCPVPMADRVRATVQLHGTISVVPEREHHQAALVLAHGRPPNPLLGVGDAAVAMRFDPQRIRVHCPGVLPATGVDVELGHYAAAVPDPMTYHEASQLCHLLAMPPDRLRALCGLLDPEGIRHATRILPVGLDRFGLVFRAETPTGARRLRLPFLATLHRVEELHHAMRALLRRAQPHGTTVAPTDRR